MVKERTFKLELKNGQTIELKFSGIAQTENQLWQMFATTEALDMVQRLIDTASPEQTQSARKTAPKKNSK